MDPDARLIQGHRIPPPAYPYIVDITTMTEDWVALYPHVPQPGQLIPVEMQPFPVEYSIPEEEEID